MIKTIFFDFDGVLTLDKTGTISTCNFFYKKYNIDYDTLLYSFRKNNKKLTLGLSTYGQLWDEICGDIGCDIPISDLAEAFLDTPINFHVINIAVNLSANSYKIGIITDNKWDRMEAIVLKYNLSSVFDPIVVSANIGVSKGSKEIFEYAMKLTGNAPEECLFIDNTKKNLEVPNQLGMHTYYYKLEGSGLEGLINYFMELNIYCI